MISEVIFYTLPQLFQELIQIMSTIVDIFASPSYYIWVEVASWDTTPEFLVDFVNGIIGRFEFLQYVLDRPLAYLMFGAGLYVFIIITLIKWITDPVGL